jgi:ABC-type multidrug transport system fused ATPase/permease subunit
MVKSRINSVLFSAIWTLAPILVSVVSFASYIWVGNQLTVSVAFTAISLFAMVRAPLNVIPTWIVFMMQTKVALDRIQGYIDDDEVDGQVSSLKEDTEGRGNKEGLGIVKGSFKWNEVEEKDEKGKGKVTEAVDLDARSDTASIPPEDVQEHVFELRDISVIFPDGQLTVVTGTIRFSCAFSVTFLLIYSRSHG